MLCRQQQELSGQPETPPAPPDISLQQQKQQQQHEHAPAGAGNNVPAATSSQSETGSVPSQPQQQQGQQGQQGQPSGSTATAGPAAVSKAAQGPSWLDPLNVEIMSIALPVRPPQERAVQLCPSVSLTPTMSTHAWQHAVEESALATYPALCGKLCIPCGFCTIEAGLPQLFSIFLSSASATPTPLQMS